MITCINLQHVREQREAVERITSARASGSVPEAFIRSADEIVVVDVSPEGLAQNKNRSGGGEPKYDTRQLSQLRELALLLAAEVVEDQLQRYMSAHGMHQSWGTQERIMVCVTPRSNARVMIESGRRNADRSHGHLFAAYVRQSHLSREAEETLEINLEYARKLGAEVHIQEGSADPVSQLIEFAQGQRITQTFVGHTQRPAWAFWSANPLKKLIEAAEGMDVRIFPHARNA